MRFRAYVQALLWCALLAGPAPLFAQATTGTIQGIVQDEQNAVVPGATVTLRHVETNVSRSVVSDEAGRFRASNLPVGTYEMTVELAGFSIYKQTGLRLALNQDAVLSVTLRPATRSETIQVHADTPILNTTTPEVGVRFDTKRIAELPVINSRDVFSLALSAAGVSQLGSGQTGFASGPSFSVNGMRVRSNNFMIDGQDSNDPSVTGRQQPINNTDTIQEIRLITNQFAAEYGRAAGSVMNVITKSGTNDFHGSGFVFHDNNHVNARTNLDKAAGRTSAPFKLETQYGGTIGGPVVRNSTFFFGSYQRWTNRELGAGFTLVGAPTSDGRAVLDSAAGDLPQVKALLKWLPAAQVPAAGKSASFTRNGLTYSVPLGSITGSANKIRNNNQASGRVDQQLGNSMLGGRYLYQGNFTDGDDQVTPPGLTTQQPSNTHATTAWFTSVLSPTMTNEVRGGHQHLGTITNASNPASQEIPSIQIAELGLAEINASSRRTAIGLAVNLPQYRYNDTYQVLDTFSYVPGNHAFKFGVDFRHIYVKSFFVPTIRGSLQYPTLQSFVDDVPQAATINKPLPGGQSVNYYKWNDLFTFAQDEWRIRSDLTLTLGVRYELPGNSIESLETLNANIVAAAGGDTRYALAPVPKKDTNNVEPRLGFNWNPHSRGGGMVGWLTGGDRLVVRGGYARTHDYAFLNIALNIASSFPFVAAINQPNLQGAFSKLADLQVSGLNPLTLTRTVVAADFRSPYANQFSFELQRELFADLALHVGYVGTQGRDLFQTLDGNPDQPFSTVRVDPTRGVIRLRANAATSDYHSLQVSLDKRFSGGLSAAAHYTWSKYLDDASEVFNPSSGEIAIPQDSFNIKADRAVSSYDRPHRFTTNVVYELPFWKDQQGVLAHVLGGWTATSTVTFQSGAPFTVFNGSDPTGALAGISGLVGNAIRPNLVSDQKLSTMTVEQLHAIPVAQLFRALCGNPSATCAGERVGDVGRNTLRADGIGNVDFGFIKNTRVAGRQLLQVRIEMYNATNTRNFGIPDGSIVSSNFLNQWGTDGGGRKIWGALRYTF